MLRILRIVALDGGGFYALYVAPVAPVAVPAPRPSLLGLSRADEGTNQQM